MNGCTKVNNTQCLNEKLHRESCETTGPDCKSKCRKSFSGKNNLKQKCYSSIGLFGCFGICPGLSRIRFGANWIRFEHRLDRNGLGPCACAFKTEATWTQKWSVRHYCASFVAQKAVTPLAASGFPICCVLLFFERVRSMDALCSDIHNEQLIFSSG